MKKSLLPIFIALTLALSLPFPSVADSPWEGTYEIDKKWRKQEKEYFKKQQKLQKEEQKHYEKLQKKQLKHWQKMERENQKYWEEMQKGKY